MTGVGGIQRAVIGETGVEVSRLGFGAAPLGNLYEDISEEQAAATIEAALEAGISHFDTAPLYGYGLSERRLGLYLDRTMRSQITVSTKIGRTLTPKTGNLPKSIFRSTPPFTENFDFTYDGVLRQVEDSLQRMGLSYLDSVVIHDIGLWHMGDMAVVNRHFSDLETGGLKALESLRSAGVIRSVGAGANELTVCDRFLNLGSVDFLLIALQYTLLNQSAAETVMPRCLKEGVGVFIGAPFQSGILATGPVENAHYEYGDVPAEILERVTKLDAICREYSVPLAAAALQFPLAHPATTALLVGMRSPDEVRKNASLVNMDIPAGLWAQVAGQGLISGP